jgi:gliding motility-associated-like protein
VTKYLLLHFLVFFVTLGYSQSEADWWYFGAEAGVHFTTTGPVADTNGQMTTQEGCASVSSSDGDLLFYTDGTYVWDATHNLMPNGDSLLGNASSTQSAVIVPYPGNTGKYCIFTVRGCTGGSSSGPPGYYFAYSVVNMALNGGLGDVDVTEKNIILFDSASEKCTAAIHANGSDIWVIGREQDIAQYHAYHLSTSGIIDSVTTTFPEANYSCVGYLLANHAGDRIATANHNNTNPVEIYPFDQATGIVGTPDTLFPGASPYGIHFSPNDQLFYAGTTGGIFQFDLTAANINSTLYQVAASSTYALAEGPDKKIYATKYQTSYLARINFPDSIGAACGFQDSAVYLEGRMCRIGLPNHVAANIFGIEEIIFMGFCIGDQTQFTFDTAGVDSVKWNFGEPSSGTNNTSTLFFPNHLYADTGFYDVVLIAYSDSLIDTAYSTIFIYPHQSIDLGSDLEFCRGEVTEFSAAQPYAQFLWHDSTTADTFQTTNDTIVWVAVFGVCDTVSDTVHITYDDTIRIELGPDTLLCNFPGGYVINPRLNVKADFEWSSEDTTVIISVVNSGIYSFTATNACNTEADTVEITFKPVPTDSLLPSDTLNCFDKAIVLARPKIPGLTYVWSDSSSKATYTLDTTEQIWLAAFNECGFSVDTMNIVFNGEIISELGVDTIICDKDFLTLSAYSPGATYLWSTGDTTDTIVTGWHSAFYTVTVTYKDCQTIESKNVEKSELYCPGIDCNVQTTNVFSPNGDGINDMWRITSDCDIFSYDLSIYNRWGQLVHFSNNAKFGWDGTINGEPASDGVYFYILHFKDGVVVDVDQFDFKGSITLVR